MWKDKHGRGFGVGDRVRVALGQLDNITSSEDFEGCCPDGWDFAMIGTLGAEGTAEEDPDPDEDDKLAWVAVTFDRKIGDRRQWCYRPTQLEIVDSTVAVPQGQLDLYDRLLEDQSFHDVTFKLSDGEERAHKSVLAAASSAFGTMFSPPMQEGATGKVSLPETPVATMRVFLRLLYSGGVESKDWQTAPSSADDEVIPLRTLLEVVTLARKYVVDNVLEVTVEALKRRLQSSKEDVNVYQDIFAAAIQMDLGAVRVAAIDVARSSSAVRQHYDSQRLRPEVQFELRGLWPPPRSSQAAPCRKRSRLV
ncbi:unnamed protein product [Prorocentrum cordatum]|uniref:BTB domain-containing protein n=1 Tax=Prorocentrum cordatum TaxID=2364126 RepID=A0ABN9XMN6_9DINO|nr:unnamed protein product [Polarella glacialis]